MGKKIKLIWDFYGEDALHVAKHHAIHLNEYVTKTNIKAIEIDSMEFSDHAEAYIIVDEQHLVQVRDQLRPKRGQWVEETPET